MKEVYCNTLVLLCCGLLQRGNMLKLRCLRAGVMLSAGRFWTRELLFWIILPIIGEGKLCDLTSNRFQDLPGEWHHTDAPYSPLGYAYDESSCPDIVHLTDCWRQSNNLTRTAAAYSARFLPQDCEFGTFTPQDAAACLGGSRKLLFIGDSLTWSQFESMACFLGPVTQQTKGTRLFDAANFVKFTHSKYETITFIGL